MRIVLEEADDKTMHASKLADKIYDRRLYLQRTVKRHSMQIRARCRALRKCLKRSPATIKLKQQ